MLYLISLMELKQTTMTTFFSILRMMQWSLMIPFAIKLTQSLNSLGL